MVSPKELCLGALKLRHGLERLKVVVFILIVVVFYNEYYVYELKSWMWPSLTSNSRSPGNEERILFVADPQIIGVRDIHMNIQLLIYDADRYLAKTFSYALKHVQPDIIVFLGDLTDEGSNANDADYELYVKRFNKIFSSTSASEVKRIYLPGDNDVGGEMWDERTPLKVNRFDKYFKREELVNTNFVDFFTFNYNVGDAVDTKMAKHLKSLVATSTAPFRIVLNHMNLLSQTRPEFDRLILYTNASLVITAHAHKAIMYTCKDCRDPDYLDVQWKGDKFLMESDVIYKLNLQDSSLLHEIVVPTCSYRMGEPTMGYGAAVIERSGEMRYVVLSSPSRYVQLIIYGIVITPILLYLVALAIKRIVKLRQLKKWRLL